LAEAKIMDGNITVPYSWTTGPAIGAFLTGIRDDMKLIGVKCSKCGQVMCPPKDICPKCFIKNDDYVTVGPAGTVVAFSVIYLPNDDQPAEPPYTLALINLDGADTNLVYLLGDVDPDDVEHGMRVEPVWKEERYGYLSADLKHFKPL